MQWWGSILGAIAGYLLAGSLGAILGFCIGYQFDQGTKQQRHTPFSQENKQQRTLFFTTTFSVLGHLSKAKGRVTKSDIVLAQTTMERFQLHAEELRAAQTAFRNGKAATFPLRAVLRQFRTAFEGQPRLRQLFIEIQLQALFTERELHPREQQLLLTIAEELAFSETEWSQWSSLFQASFPFGQRFSQQQRYTYTEPPESAQQQTHQEAYKLLGVTPSDSVETIKRAYKKLIMRYHPDKWAAKHASPATIELTKQKAQKIQAAYNLIKREKKF